MLCTLSADGCTAHVPDFPKVTAQAPTLDAALLEVKQQIQKALCQYKNLPIPTKQEQICYPASPETIDITGFFEKFCIAIRTNKSSLKRQVSTSFFLHYGKRGNKLVTLTPK